MEDAIFLISLVGKRFRNNRSIVGCTDNNDRTIIASYIKDKYKLNLGEQLLNEFFYQNGIHWEYETDYNDVKVHIDMIDKIE